MTQRRNDPHHFPAVNGSGHRRRKVINQPIQERFDLSRLDPFELRAVEMVAEWDRLLDDAAKQHARNSAVEYLDDWWHQQDNPQRRGEPGE